MIRVHLALRCSSVDFVEPVDSSKQACSRHSRPLFSLFPGLHYQPPRWRSTPMVLFSEDTRVYCSMASWVISQPRLWKGIVTTTAQRMKGTKGIAELVNEKQHHDSEDGVLFTLHMYVILYWTGVRYIVYAIVLTRDDTLTVSINSKTQSKLKTLHLIKLQLIMTDEFKGVTIAPLTTSTYASWSVEMEALLRAKGLWKCHHSLLKT